MVLSRCLEIVAKRIDDQWQLLAQRLNLPIDGTSSQQSSQANMKKCFENVQGEISWKKLKSWLQQMNLELLLKELKSETNLTYGN